MRWHRVTRGLLVVLLVQLAAASPVARATEPPGPTAWQQVRSAEGIVVHRRKLPGSSLHEFRGRGVVMSPMAKVIAVVQDSARRTEWMDRCIDARLIERPTDRSQIAYNRTKG